MVKYEEIQKANAEIKTTDIKGKDYAEVNQRIKAFRMVYPKGSIITDIVSIENGVVTIKATIFCEDGKILGTGYAQEKEGSTFINKTSFIENCETSAVGRALGMCGFGIDTSVASYEEVATAIVNQNKLDGQLLNECKRLNIELSKVASYFRKELVQLTNDDLRKCIEQKQQKLGGQK